MEEDICVHFLISGKVQGVFYRANAVRRANTLGLTGWIRNLPTNQVEALICGPKNKIIEMEKWLHTGPPAAHVTQVIVTPRKIETHTGFNIRE